MEGWVGEVRQGSGRVGEVREDNVSGGKVRGSRRGDNIGYTGGMPGLVAGIEGE
jgi:hypothetical protein